MGAKLHHHIGEHLLFSGGTIHPNIGNAGVLDLHGLGLIQLGPRLCQNFAGRSVHHVFRQGLAI